MHGDIEGIDMFTCLLCWEVFDGPGDLAQHEQDECDRSWPIDGLDQPSTNAETM